ncbi:MAG TPA: AI-2E family transporter [Acidimicrobiia bacterium]|nr:AI-2E family transporter [Acidimicrobiia bacterium]
MEAPAVAAADGASPDGRVDDDQQVPPWLRRAIALFFVWVIGLVLAYWVVTKLRVVILMVAVALFLSLAMEPPVNRLVKRGWPRHGATGLVWGAFLVVTIGFVAAFGSVAFTQTSQLVNNTAHYVRNVVAFVNRDFGTHINANGLIRNLQSPNGAVQKFGRSLAKDAPNVALTIGKSLLEIIVTFIFAYYLTADAQKFRRTICSRLPPRRQQIVLDTWELAVDKTGAYLYSRFLQAIICTAAVWVFLFLLGIPSSFALAVWVGVVSQFIPTFGTYLALVLPALVALLYDPVDALWVIAFLVGYQQFENYILGPRIARRTLKIHPALTIGAAFAGVLLLGPVGALLALPATAVIQALLSTYTDEQEVIETDMTTPDAPRRRRIRLPRLSFTRRKVPDPPPPDDTEPPVSVPGPAPGARRRTPRDADT